MTLLEQYNKNKNNEMGNDQNGEMEMPLATVQNVEDVNIQLIGEDEENGQIMTDDEIVEDVTSRDEEEDDERDEGACRHTVNNDAAMDAVSTSVKWAEENIVSASDILVLKRIQEKVLNVYLQAKKQKKFDSFFYSNGIRLQILYCTVS